jgi:hypothetical protein
MAGVETERIESNSSKNMFITIFLGFRVKAIVCGYKYETKPVRCKYGYNAGQI